MAMATNATTNAAKHPRADPSSPVMTTMPAGRAPLSFCRAFLLDSIGPKCGRPSPPAGPPGIGCRAHCLVWMASAVLVRKTPRVRRQHCVLARAWAIGNHPRLRLPRGLARRALISRPPEDYDALVFPLGLHLRVEPSAGPPHPTSAAAVVRRCLTSPAGYGPLEQPRCYLYDEGESPGRCADCGRTSRRSPLRSLSVNQWHRSTLLPVGDGLDV
jgi:hypothetical protein